MFYLALPNQDGTMIIISWGVVIFCWILGGAGIIQAIFPGRIISTSEGIHVKTRDFAVSTKIVPYKDLVKIKCSASDNEGLKIKEIVTHDSFLRIDLIVENAAQFRNEFQDYLSIQSPN